MLHLIGEDVVADFIVVAQRGAVKFLEPREVTLVKIAQCIAERPGLVVGKLVVEAVVAKGRGIERKQAGVLLPIAAKKARQALGRIGRGARGGRTVCGRGVGGFGLVAGCGKRRGYQTGENKFFHEENRAMEWAASYARGR